MVDVRRINTLSELLDFYGLFLVVFAVQIAFWTQTWFIVPDMEVVPNVPGEAEARALSLGDEQFYFRWHAFNIQNAGWTFGRTTSLSEFNYEKIYYWFKLLDRMDNESNFVPALASYYYARTEHANDIRYMVRYLHEYAGHRLGRKWWWQAEAVHLADHKLNDRDLALQMAMPLQHLYTAPIIIRELPAFVYERRGENDEARRVIEELKLDATLTEGELNFMHYFLEERLKKRDPKTLYYDQRKAVSD